MALPSTRYYELSAIRDSLVGMELSQAIETVLNDIITHYNTNIVAQFNEQMKEQAND